jgi:hypothetical protein
MDEYENEEVYITVYRPMSGWKAVCMSSVDGPIQTGYWAWSTREKAVEDARLWAEAEELPLKV